MLNKNDFLKQFEQKPAVKVKIESLKADVELRALSISELDEFIKQMNSDDKMGAIFYAVSKGCVNPSFSIDELQSLSGQALKALDEISTHILKLSQETTELTPR